MEFLLGLLFLFIGYYILIVCLKMILVLIEYLLDMLCGLAIEILLACWKGFWSMLKHLGETLSECCIWAGNNIWATVAFSYFLMVESLGGNSSRPNDHDQETETEDHLAKQKAHNNSYENALKLLGLEASCTQEEFNRAFRSAIVRAHPDKGGTHEQALALNAARNVLKTHNGWR